MIRRIIKITFAAVALLLLAPLTILIRRVYGLSNIPKDGPIIIIANHPTQYDPFLIYASVMITTGKHVRFITAKKLYRNPIRRLFFWMMRCIKVTKPKRRTIINASKVIRRGGTVGIFPEGGLSHKNHIIKTGYLRLAYDTDSVILPIRFTNTPGIIWRGIFPKIRTCNIIIGPSFKVKKPRIIKREKLRKESEKYFNENILNLDK